MDGSWPHEVYPDDHRDIESDTRISRVFYPSLRVKAGPIQQKPLSAVRIEAVIVVCALTGSNRRPAGCKPAALPAELKALKGHGSRLSCSQAVDKASICLGGKRKPLNVGLFTPAETMAGTDRRRTT